MVDILSTKYKERQGTDKEKLLGKFGKAFSRMFFTGLPCSRLPETLREDLIRTALYGEVAHNESTGFGVSVALKKWVA